MRTAKQSANFTLLNKLVQTFFAAALTSSEQVNSSPGWSLSSLSQFASGISQASINVDMVCRIRLSVEIENRRLKHSSQPFAKAFHIG